LRRPSGGTVHLDPGGPDIATGWSESLPVTTRDGASVLAAIQRLRKQLPFSLRRAKTKPEMREQNLPGPSNNGQHITHAK